jgi:hypothetical protein
LRFLSKEPPTPPSPARSVPSRTKTAPNGERRCPLVPIVTGRLKAMIIKIPAAGISTPERNSFYVGIPDPPIPM